MYRYRSMATEPTTTSSRPAKVIHIRPLGDGGAELIRPVRATYTSGVMGLAFTREVRTPSGTSESGYTIGAP